MTDDQTLDRLSVLPKTRALIGDRGTTFTRSFVNYSLCCPSRSTLYTGPVRPQPRRAQQQAADRRLHAPRHLQLAPALAAGGGLPDDARRQVPQRLRQGRAAHGPARLRRLERHGRPLDLHATTATRSTRTASCEPTPASTPPTSSPPRANELIAAAAPAAAPVLHVGRLPGPAQRAARASPTTRPASRRRRPAPKYANAFASTAAAEAGLLQRGRHVGQAARDAGAPARSAPCARQRSRRPTSSGSSRCCRSTTPSPRSSPRCAPSASSTTR